MSKTKEEFEIKNQKLIKYNGTEKHVVIPAKIRAIEGNAFAEPYKYCETLESVDIPLGTFEICFDAFKGCCSLKQLIVPTGVEIIEDRFVYECYSLEKVSLPHTVKYMGHIPHVFGGGGVDFSMNGDAADNPFLIGYATYKSPNYKPSLKTISVDERNPYFCDVDGVLFNKNKTKLIAYPQGREEDSYAIPEGVTEIGKEAFKDCRNLKHIALPNTLVEIQASAFYACENLSTVELPNGLIRIVGMAFHFCKSLTNITIPDSVDVIESGAFEREIITIKCYENSTAHKYAIKENIKFELI